MLPRTLSNYMNAFTASDHTFYPFATTNQQDFKNLLGVYLDATLRPLLKETDFTQEGWRVGPENPKAAEVDGAEKQEESPLVFKGVVYNEMKGQMSDAGYLFYIRFQDHIFPAINNSGGDPQKMTELTYEQLKNFHAKNYHPSNAKVFTYGDMPLADHLVEVNAQLSTFERAKDNLEIKTPIDLSNGPQSVTLPGPIDPMVDLSMQFKTSVTWMMGDSADIVEQFSLGMLSNLLSDGYGSPLYRNLIESGLGTEWSPNHGFDGSGRTAMFTVGVTGVTEGNVPKVKEAIHKTFQDARKNGFDVSKIDGYLHQLELQLKHKTAKFGMRLMQRVKPGWFQGIDPFESLAWDSTVTAFKENMAKGGYLESLLEKYLLNDNTFTFTMTPSTTYGEELVQEEATRLADKLARVEAQAGGKAEARAKLEKKEFELLEEQAKTNTQDLSCLPTVYVKDIPREKEKKILRHSVVDNVKVQWREAATNGLTYFQAINVFENLPEELRAFFPLFSSAIMRLGTKDATMEQLEDLMNLKTGGLSASYNVSPSPLDFHATNEGLAFSGTALDRNVPDMFQLLRKLVLETNFDGPQAEAQIRQLLQSSADGAVNQIASSGHGYAMTFAQSGLTNHGRLREQISGLSQIKLVTSLAARPEAEGLADVISKLKAIQQLAFSGLSTFRTSIVCGSESASTNETHLRNFLSTLPKTNSPTPPAPTPQFTKNSKTFFPLPYQVYYGALSLPTVAYNSPSSAPLQILSQLLTHKHLLHEIREKGGAYGAGAYAKPLEGLFGFYSYRDPNPQNTLKVLSEAGKWAVDKAFSQQDLDEAKISVFQSADAPKAVSEEGQAEFQCGITHEMMAERRERLLDVSRDQVREVAQKFVAERLEAGEGALAFLGQKKEWVDAKWEIQNLGPAVTEAPLVEGGEE